MSNVNIAKFHCYLFAIDFKGLNYAFLPFTCKVDAQNERQGSLTSTRKITISEMKIESPNGVLNRFSPYLFSDGFSPLGGTIATLLQEADRGANYNYPAS